ncbi:MAG TPA: winged helix-turn-helix domain-containing protein [Candidatus Dormibacteraeota bacterium]|nr:winged helix-turn-helix domain-containing protein [Candidatus Dormibacteraeota bacterium]
MSIGYLQEMLKLVEKIGGAGTLIARMDAKSDWQLYRFGVFEADARTGELRKQGRKLPLQGQPLQVLLMLLERAGELVARAEIQQRLWVDGTFVDFDHGLNTAINKIRETLGDSASSPRFVETLARRGYRFIAPVEVVSVNSVERPSGSGSKAKAAQPGMTAAEDLLPAPAALSEGSLMTAKSEGAETLAPAPRRSRNLLASPDELPEISRRVARTLFLLLQVMYLGFYAVSLARLRIVEIVVAGTTVHASWAIVALIVTAAVGIPIRLYLISAAGFDAPGLRERFLKLFPVVFPLDELWALSPFLLAPWIGFGAALGATAALLYAPFAQRSLILMGAGAPARTGPNSSSLNRV